MSKANREPLDKLLYGKSPQSDRQYEQFVDCIFNHVQEAIFVVDIATDGGFYYRAFNSVAKKLTGIKDVANKTPEEVFAPSVAAAIIQHYQQCLEAKADISYQEYLPAKQGEILWLTTLSPLEDDTGSIYRLVGRSVNITERQTGIKARQQAEQALSQLNEQLETRVTERTAQLEKLNGLLAGTTAKLTKSNQELTQFASVVSHDLKAPLRAIASLATWIEEDLPNDLDADTKHNLELLKSRVHRLENLIDGLLAYSRFGKLQSQPKEVQIEEMLREIIDTLTIAPDCTVKIVGEMPTLITEAAPLQQVFGNLISNAIKHSDRDHSIVTISVAEQPEFYQLTVQDNGRGIEPQYHERIFEIFQTLKARDEAENTGIGLSIVKKAVENQGGKITVKLKLGSGASFSFTWKKKPD